MVVKAHMVDTRAVPPTTTIPAALRISSPALTPKAAMQVPTHAPTSRTLITSITVITASSTRLLEEVISPTLTTLTNNSQTHHLSITTTIVAVHPLQLAPVDLVRPPTLSMQATTTIMIRDRHRNKALLPT